MRWQVCALAAEIVGEALAIGGLREHARERVFADAARAGEEQGVRDAAAAESAAQSGDDAFVAEKFGEAHVSALLTLMATRVGRRSRAEWRPRHRRRYRREGARRCASASKHSMVIQGTSRESASYMSAASWRWRRLASSMSCFALV